MNPKEDALFLRRMQDLAERADRIGYVVWSDFLDGGQRSELQRMALPPQIKVQYIGGYKDAERVVAAFYPSFLIMECEDGEPDPAYDSPIKALSVTVRAAKFARKLPGHRDYLGALMGLGIRRETMGDILVDGESAVVIASSAMADYIRENLTSVGAVEVDVEEMPFSGIGQHLADGKEMVIGVSSERLDAVISKVFHLSRQDSARDIQAGRVMVNWKETVRSDYAVHEGDRISVRGHGRIRVLEQVGTSRSGRLQIRIERFGS